MSDRISAGAIVVVAEHFQGEIRPVTYELVHFAEMLQQHRPLTPARPPGRASKAGSHAPHAPHRHARSGQR